MDGWRSRDSGFAHGDVARNRFEQRLEADRPRPPGRRAAFGVDLQLQHAAQASSSWPTSETRHLAQTRLEACGWCSRSREPAPARCSGMAVGTGCRIGDAVVDAMDAGQVASAARGSGTAAAARVQQRLPGRGCTAACSRSSVSEVRGRRRFGSARGVGVHQAVEQAAVAHAVRTASRPPPAGHRAAGCSIEHQRCAVRMERAAVRRRARIMRWPRPHTGPSAGSVHSVDAAQAAASCRFPWPAPTGTAPACRPRPRCRPSGRCCSAARPGRGCAAGRRRTASGCATPAPAGGRPPVVSTSNLGSPAGRQRRAGRRRGARRCPCRLRRWPGARGTQRPRPRRQQRWRQPASPRRSSMRARSAALLRRRGVVTLVLRRARRRATPDGAHHLGPQQLAEFQHRRVGLVQAWRRRACGRRLLGLAGQAAGVSAISQRASASVGFGLHGRRHGG